MKRWLVQFKSGSRTYVILMKAKTPYRAVTLALTESLGNHGREIITRARKGLAITVTPCDRR